MLRNLKQLLGSTVTATDGHVGKVGDFYFDDEKWTIRYFIVDTGSWLTGRRVLVSPSAFGKPDWLTHQIPVNLSKEKVKNSPEVDLTRPLTRELEESLHQYYGWLPYWSGIGLSVSSPVRTKTFQAEKERKFRRGEKTGEPRHLQSVKNVMGYRLSALDGEIGHIENFLADDTNWMIRYVIVDTQNWLPGRKVLIAPQWIKDFVGTKSKAIVKLKKQRIEESPQYHQHVPVERAYEEELYAHYSQEKYWGSQWDKAAKPSKAA